LEEKGKKRSVGLDIWRLTDTKTCTKFVLCGGGKVGRRQQGGVGRRGDRTKFT